MTPASSTNIGICAFESPVWLIFSEGVPPLVYYSHLPIALITLMLGLFVLYMKPRSSAAHGLLLMTVSFALWVLLDSVFWASNRGDVITYVWSMQILLEPLIYIGAFYLIYSLVKEKPLSFRTASALALLYIPVVITVPTHLMLYAFDENTCLSLEGPLATYYTYGIELVILVALVVVSINEIITNKFRRKEISILLFGTVCLLLMFTLGNIISSISGDWQFAQIGLFTMPLFMSVLVFVIVKYSTMHFKLVSTYALIAAITGLTFSLLFVTNIEILRPIAAVTFLLSLLFGVLLIKAVGREIKQREQIEKLAERLEKANVRLKELDKMKSEFVSIASHQLRSPLTAISGYTSMLTEGSFGKLPEKAREAVARIQESSRMMTVSVEDYLNVSRIQSGNMKYELSDFNLRDLVSKTVDDQRRVAMKRGLLITFSDKLAGSKGITNADIGKTKQIIFNLTDNAMKYTPKGKIEVVVKEDMKNKVLSVHISDSGIGMKEGQAEELFEKFSRAKNANSINVTGTGLGLYIARKMANDMGGDITASSPGENLGSTFTLTLPLHL